MGLPKKELLEKIEDKNLVSFLLQSFKMCSKAPWEEVFPEINPECLDLIKKLLTYDPEERLSARDVLAHPFLKDLHNQSEEPRAKEITYFDFEFEQYSLSKSILKDLILDE